jgi:hypothetical protein
MGLRATARVVGRRDSPAPAAPGLIQPWPGSGMSWRISLTMPPLLIHARVSLLHNSIVCIDPRDRRVMRVALDDAPSHSSSPFPQPLGRGRSRPWCPYRGLRAVRPSRSGSHRRCVNRPWTDLHSGNSFRTHQANPVAPPRRDNEEHHPNARPRANGSDLLSEEMGDVGRGERELRQAMVEGSCGRF